MNMPLVLLNRRRRGFTAFSPSTLFALSEPGVWFDPSDLTTLFQDTAGTTPVTAPGNTVGLMLDKSRGATLGPELVKNGTFNADAAEWTAYNSPTVSVSSGQVTVTNSTVVAGRISQAISCNVGVNYVFKANFIAKNGSAASLRISTTPAGDTAVAQVSNTTGTAELLQAFFIATATTMYVQLITNTDQDFVFSTWDNISVRELAGNHATQATLAARPTYSVEPVGGRRNLLLNTDTLATQSVTVTAVEHVLSFTGTGTITLSGVSTAGPLVGTGADNRVSLTFTPTAGSLTLTVSGSVTFAQLERA